MLGRHERQKSRRGRQRMDSGKRSREEGGEEDRRSVRGKTGGSENRETLQLFGLVGLLP
jgi:hypothetical protein